MKQWDVHLRYTPDERVTLQHLNNRLHPERFGSNEHELWLVLRQHADSLIDATITAIARVDELVELELRAVWAEEAHVVVLT